MASRALAARLMIAFSSPETSAKVRHRPPASTVSMMMSSRSVRRSMSSMSASSRFTLTLSGDRDCWRANARSLRVRVAARSTLCRPPSMSSCTWVSPRSSRRAMRRRLLITTASMLLKSCAMPPVSWPMASSFWICRSCTSVCSRRFISASSFVLDSVSCAVRAATCSSSVAFSSASLVVRSCSLCETCERTSARCWISRTRVGGGIHHRARAHPPGSAAELLDRAVEIAGCQEGEDERRGEQHGAEDGEIAQLPVQGRLQRRLRQTDRDRPLAARRIGHGRDERNAFEAGRGQRPGAVPLQMLDQLGNQRLTGKPVIGVRSDEVRAVPIDHGNDPVGRNAGLTQDLREIAWQDDGMQGPSHGLVLHDRHDHARRAAAVRLAEHVRDVGPPLLRRVAASSPGSIRGWR